MFLTAVFILRKANFCWNDNLLVHYIFECVNKHDLLIGFALLCSLNTLAYPFKKRMYLWFYSSSYKQTGYLRHTEMYLHKNEFFSSLLNRPDNEQWSTFTIVQPENEYYVFFFFLSFFLSFEQVIEKS